MTRASTIAVVLVLAIAACKRTGENPNITPSDKGGTLSREKALSILKQSDMQKQALVLRHVDVDREAGDRDKAQKFFERARADGFITLKRTPFSGNIEAWPSPTAKGAQFCRLESEDVIGEFVMAIPEATEILSVGVPSQMDGNTVCTVNFKLNYGATSFGTAFAQATGLMNRYSGFAEGRAVFALYDDGWHLENWRRVDK